MEQLKFDIGTSRNPIIVKFEEFNSLKLVDIRKYYIKKKDPDTIHPSTKGISLNGYQFKQLIDLLNFNSSAVTEYFETDEVNQINIEFKPIIGRSFQFKYENDKTTVIIDEKLCEKVTRENIVLFTKMIEAFNTALIEVLEKEDEIELIMDIVNQKLSRIL